MEDKLKLEDLKIQSFVTASNNIDINNIGIVGGADITTPLDHWQTETRDGPQCNPTEAELCLTAPPGCDDW
ncbi:MAG: pinensin family lanthipeptide [Phaeodactylibacter sp.]|nr:pinensin family lanthipeptide [Phaeodactylibacter sp.]